MPTPYTKITDIQLILAQTGCKTFGSAISYQASSCGPSLPPETTVPCQAVPTATALTMGKPLRCSPHPTGAAKQLGLGNAHRWARTKQEKQHGELGLSWAERCHLQALWVKSSLLHLAYLIKATFAMTEPWICASAVHWLQGTCLLQKSATNNNKSHYDKMTWWAEIQVHTSPRRILIWNYSLYHLLYS